jgi:hypothetical protein
MPAEAGTPHILSARKVVFLSLIPTKQGVVPTSEGVIPTKQGVVPTSEGVIPTKQGVFPTKQGKVRKNKALFCTNQHVANTKFAPKCDFCLQNALFCQLLRYLLLPNLYTHGQRGIFVPQPVRSTPLFLATQIVFRAVFP